MCQEEASDVRRQATVQRNNHQQLACLPKVMRVWGLLQLECVIKHLDLDLP